MDAGDRGWVGERTQGAGVDPQGSRPVFIYGLVDPRDERVYYVGKSVKPTFRKCDHEKCARRCTRETHGRCAWIAGLLASGLRPVLAILEQVAAEEWEDAERAWIEYAQWSGWPLTNLTPGGPGKFKLPKSTV